MIRFVLIIALTGLSLFLMTELSKEPENNKTLDRIERLIAIVGIVVAGILIIKPF